MTDNLIDKLVFELGIDQRSDFDILVDQIPANVVNELTEFIEQQLDEFKIGEQYVLINKLEIDVGTLDLDNFASSLIEKFKQEFIISLQKILKSNSGSKFSNDELPFILIQYFLQQGAMPWWVNTRSISFNVFFQQALQINSKRAISYMQQMHAHPAFKKRFLENIKEELLVDVLFSNTDQHQLFDANRIFSIKILLKRRFQHLSAYQISILFKKILVDLILNPYKITDSRRLLFLLIGSLKNNLIGNEYGEFQSNLFDNKLRDLFQKDNISEQITAIAPSSQRGVNSSSSLVQRLYYYLENGYSLPERSASVYKYQNFNTLFAYLLKGNLEDIVDFLLMHGRNNSIKKRFLESVSQDLLSKFFLLVAPGKRKLLEWVVAVFEKVQEDYKPINQTFIQVKKSINEITFELFLNKKINSISDINYLRLLFRQTAKKYGIQYKVLLFYTLKSNDSTGSKYKSSNYHQLLLGLYQKDVIKKSASSFLIPKVTPKDYQDIVSNDYKNSAFVHGLFLELYKVKFKRSSPKVSDWLKTNMQFVNLDQTINLIQFWETFASKFNIQAEGLIIPLMSEYSQNPSLDLTAKSFKKLKIQYKLNDVYLKRKPKMLELISSLQNQENLIPKKILIQIFQQVKSDQIGDKLVFLKFVKLINPKLSPLMDDFVKWLNQTTQNHGLVQKQANVFNWLIHQLLLSSRKKYTLSLLKELTLEFLKISDLPLTDKTRKVEVFEKKKNQLGIAKELKDFNKNRNANKTTYYKSNSELSRFFELIGRSEIYGFFPDAHRYNERSLFQLLITKYGSEFLLTLKKNQFNVELCDFILIQAPKWLKKDTLTFLDQHNQQLWFQSMGKISKSLTETAWLDLKGASLNLFLEKVLWTEALGANNFHYQDFFVLVIQKAAANRLFTEKFWEDYVSFEAMPAKEQRTIKSTASNQLKILDQQGYLSYLNVFYQNAQKLDRVTPIFESLIYKSVFPSAHVFEGYKAQDFKSYINRMVTQNRPALGMLLRKIGSKPLLNNFFQYLDFKVMKSLTIEVYQQAAVILPLKKIDLILKYFKITDQRKQHLIFSNLIVLVVQNKGVFPSQVSIISGLLISLFNQGIVTRKQFLIQMDWMEFFERIGFNVSEKDLFFDDLKKHQLFNIDIEYLSGNKKEKTNMLLSSTDLDFIYFPNSFSILQYQSFIKRLLAKELILKSHQTFITEWVSFAVAYKDKEYLQSVIQIYFFNKLHSVTQHNSLKSQIVYALLNKLGSDKKKLDTFLLRLSNYRSLIDGVPLLGFGDHRKSLSNKWVKIWQLANKNAWEASNSKEFTEYFVHLLINRGLSFFEKQESLKNITPRIVDEIKSLPLNKLFLYDIHNDFWVDLFQIKSETEVFGYFINGNDPYLKQLKEQKILSFWLEVYFNRINQKQAIEFLVLFQKNFYINTTNFDRKAELFFNDFLSLPDGKKSYQEVLKIDKGELELFNKNAPVLFKEMQKFSIENKGKLELDEILQWFLNYGVLPIDMVSLKDLGKALSSEKGKSLLNYRLLIHGALQTSIGRKNVIKLLSFLDEEWFFKLIHPKLPFELNFLNRSIRNKINKNLFAKLRITQKLDRLIYITDIWKSLNVLIKHPVEILIHLVENWVKDIDPVLIDKVFNQSDSKPELFVLLVNSSQKIKRILDNIEEETVVFQLEEKLEIEELDYGEGVTIANAGLILCWPFYGRFFSALGMVQNGELDGEIMEEKAIQLLQYIATGKVESEEWNLTLNKILCGVKPDFPVSPLLELSTEEEELCNKLINGTIYNWEKIRGTKLETFRETFLNREGRLFEKDNRWELIVEKKAYDVLLDTLPWNISMINLSWMKKRLTIQWL